MNVQQGTDRTILTDAIRAAEHHYMAQGSLPDGFDPRVRLAWRRHARYEWGQVLSIADVERVPFSSMAVISVACRYQADTMARIMLCELLGIDPDDGLGPDELILLASDGHCDKARAERGRQVIDMIAHACDDPHQAVQMRAILAVICLAAARPGEALRHCREVLSVDPSHPWAGGVVLMLPQPPEHVGCAGHGPR